MIIEAFTKRSRIEETDMRTLIAIGLVFGITQPAAAQDKTCFSSIGVKSGQSVVLSTLRGGTGAQIVGCAAAENWRTEFYIKNKPYLDAVSQGNSAYYVSELSASIGKLETAIKNLERAIAANEPKSAIVLAFKVMIYEATKVDAILTCTRNWKSWTCAVDVAGVITATWDVLTGDIANSQLQQTVTKQKSQLAGYKARLAELNSDLGKINMKEVKADIEDTFFGMCKAIRRDCL